jgi:hypothetical protein
MVVLIAPEIPFHPSECPRCKFLTKEGDRCKAYTSGPHPVPGIPPLLAEFRGRSTNACPRFSEARRSKDKKKKRTQDMGG